METPYLSVIIPAYNEQETIEATLRDIDKYLLAQGFDYEIIVVSDGSRDKTIEIVRNLQPQIKNLRFIDNKENHGKGWVIRQAMLDAKGKYRLFMDADNATTINHIEKMKPFFEQNYGVIIGTRDEKDAEGAKQAVPQPFLKRQLGNVGNILIQIVAVWGIWDTQCGFKVFSDKAAQEIFSRTKIDRWGFDIEALALAKKLKYKIGIIPVYWINNPHSRVNLKAYLNTFKELFQVKWNLIRGKYNIRK